MVDEPEIRRRLPTTTVVELDTPAPVTVRLRWLDGADWKEPSSISALALARSHDAVRIAWRHGGKNHTDWIDLTDVSGL